MSDRGAPSERWHEVCRWPGDGGLDLVLETQRKPVLWVPHSATFRETEIAYPQAFRVEIGWEHVRFTQGESEAAADELRQRLLKIGWGVIGRKLRLVPRMRGLFEE